MVLSLKVSQLNKKIETLKQEKHELFSQLKKVLHQEDETRKRAQLKEQRFIYFLIVPLFLSFVRYTAHRFLCVTLAE